ncbi:hypothetical protein ES702_00105 [subsurface metagenome]
MWPSQAKIGVRRPGVILVAYLAWATLMCFGSVGGNGYGVLYPGSKVDSGERDMMRLGRRKSDRAFRGFADDNAQSNGGFCDCRCYLGNFNL